MSHLGGRVWPPAERVIVDVMRMRLARRVSLRSNTYCPVVRGGLCDVGVQRRVRRNRSRRGMGHAVPVDAGYGVAATVTTGVAATKGMGANASAGKPVTTTTAAAMASATTAAASTPGVAATTATPSATTGGPGTGQSRRRQSQGRHTNEYRESRLHDALSASTTRFRKRSHQADGHGPRRDTPGG